VALRFVVPEAILRRWALATIQRQLEKRLRAQRALKSV
jgi:hypothetical protein